ncbi:MAG TPA: DedA family protein [Gemmatimonadaceae bacterium]
MDSALATLAGLPAGLLYPVFFLVAVIENLLPPFPSDVVFAFGAFIAAQGRHEIALVFASAWSGNVAGALVVYHLGRRYGAGRLDRQLAGAKASQREARLRDMFARYGLPALFLARFIPGVRAIVPPAAGALKVSMLTTGILVGAASAVWYGVITLVAFRVGNDWQQLRESIGEFSRVFGVAAAIVVALGLVTWALVRRRQSSP